MVVGAIPPLPKLAELGSSFVGSQEDRTRLQERIAGAQKALRLHGIGEISTSKPMTTSYVEVYLETFSPSFLWTNLRAQRSSPR